TLLRAVTGVIACDDGRLDVLGIDPAREPLRLKPILGYVPQTFSMYPTLTVGENLTFVARVHGLRRADYQRRATELLALARLSKFVDRRAENLSGGMQRKLSLVGALLGSPRLLVLDEPNAGVDIDARSEFWEVIRETARTALVLLATNYLDEAERCDRILYLTGGQLLIEGTPTEIRRLADVKVFRVRSSRRYGNGLVSALSRVEGVKRVETGGDSARFHAIVERDDLESRISQLGLDATIEEVDPDLETALLSLESRRRKINRDRLP